MGYTSISAGIITAARMDGASTGRSGAGTFFYRSQFSSQARGNLYAHSSFPASYATPALPESQPFCSVVAAGAVLTGNSMVEPCQMHTKSNEPGKRYNASGISFLCDKGHYCEDGHMIPCLPECMHTVPDCAVAPRVPPLLQPWQGEQPPSTTAPAAMGLPEWPLMPPHFPAGRVGRAIAAPWGWK